MYREKLNAMSMQQLSRSVMWAKLSYHKNVTPPPNAAHLLYPFFYILCCMGALENPRTHGEAHKSVARFGYQREDHCWVGPVVNGCETGLGCNERPAALQARARLSLTSKNAGD